MNLWYKKGDKNKGIHPQIELSENWALRGLYWLSKDFSDYDFGDSIEPESKDIALIRNFIEHKSFKIVETFNPNWTEQTKTYEIDRSLFYDKTFKIIKICRSAIMYLSFCLNIEEDKKNVSLKSIPIYFENIKDNEKT